MIVGLDFDNTIVSYETVFHKAALEKGYIDEAVESSKVAVRDHLRARGEEALWTELQGYVYGACMEQAEISVGVADAIGKIKGMGAEVHIISHKTQYPFAGPRYDLHKAARNWISANLTNDDGPLFGSGNVKFLATVKQKISRIRELSCDVFVDDLPEILSNPDFPQQTQRFLFDPDNIHRHLDDVVVISNWDQFVERVAP